MSTVKDFIIKFKGLAIGTHEFSYLLDEDFFKEMNEEDFVNGKVNLTILLNKEETMLTFDFQMQGKVTVICDRCLDNLNMPVNSNEKLYVKFGEGIENDSDEIIYIPETDYQIDLFEYIRQELITLLPIQKIHLNDEYGNSTCNQNMLNKIKSLSIENNTNETNTISDPRWDKLKELR